MGASLESVKSYLTGVYGEAFAKQLLERTDMHKMLLGDKPRRMSHLEKPTEAQVKEFETWRRNFKHLEDIGWANGWLEIDWDNGTEIVNTQPYNVVYDETEEEWQERLAAWEAVQPARPAYVTFPVINRAKGDDHDPDQPLEG